MHEDVVEKYAPSGQRSDGDRRTEVWKNVKVLRLGFYKVCWCTGILSGCQRGRDFPFVAGYVIVTGELPTVTGNGKPVQASDGDPEGWQFMNETKVGWVSGL